MARNLSFRQQENPDLEDLETPYAYLDELASTAQ